MSLRDAAGPTRCYEDRAPFPELEPHCGSWMVTHANGKVWETFSRALAKQAHSEGYKVETAGQYLGRINLEKPWEFLVTGAR